MICNPMSQQGIAMQQRSLMTLGVTFLPHVAVMSDPLAKRKGYEFPQLA